MPLEPQGWGPDFFDAFRNGEEEAFDRVFRDYHGPLTYYAFKYVRDEKLAEDIVQDCFAELWIRRNKLSQVQSIKSYLYRCVYNHCSKLLDQMKRRTAAVTEFQTDSDETNIIEGEILYNILQVIDHLPLRMKQVLRMFYLEEKSLTEIGMEIGIDPETVRSHRYRAIQLIKRTIITG